MNDRIKELMNEAVRFHWDHDGQAYEAQVHPEDLEYFAELIVRECVRLCNEIEEYDEYPESEAEACAEYILKHFGVEE